MKRHWFWQHRWRVLRAWWEVEYLGASLFYEAECVICEKRVERSASRFMPGSIVESAV